ncbi:uncharacterized protein CBO05P1_038 [Clostridium botulinum B str. Osaka05]|uniref:Uncharacterized protein n=1 Tax=Clostridium botulinum B str. Osaka05 TaxID=1407017 RepID=A0A060N4Q7_CLOBO|nr:hypothetical protein [Clostridium botulinum]BAO04757.1 uncharacterized protein CBO05P1_038 [Clostridium botulinum B str. Osaka05]
MLNVIDNKEELDKVFKEKQLEFITRYEKEHEVDLYDIFKNFKEKIAYNNNSIEINIANYPELFETKNKSMFDDFCYYLELKGFKYDFYPRIGVGIIYVIKISL